LTATKEGVNIFGIGEQNCKNFLDCAPTMILAAEATRTKQIYLNKNEASGYWSYGMRAYSETVQKRCEWKPVD